MTDAERSEILEFADAGEYGIALHRAVSIYIEEGKTPIAAELEIIRELTELMNQAPGPLLQTLAKAGHS